ncbi:DUF3597 domain-containing protein [Blastochloris sulfoviridis]|uniref:DUF3597 domain-containing protein n=1 Tax=Blastochloris sulfoviridis TaxID=50712 RepID=A0A5M6HTI6_9HYPH|nr:DUF3597 domain-containing protein [Blastochloris sulfoviridis]KAA5598967.1 DUF3597 domain-containing protein [Blastochloris sulfoviridis]
MSILDKIVSSIFGRAKASEVAATPAKPASPAASAASAAPASASAAATATASVDVAAVLSALASQTTEKLDWRRSIVDLLKLLDLDSSLAARKELARELHYPGDPDGSAAMNVWLHKQVMQKLADNGGKVPDDLKD